MVHNVRYLPITGWGALVFEWVTGFVVTAHGRRGLDIFKFDAKNITAPHPYVCALKYFLS